MDLVSELQALQFLRPVKEAAVTPPVTWGKPWKALSQPGTIQAETALPHARVCPDTARRLKLRALAAGAVA